MFHLRKKTQVSARAGFTLVEVIVAVSLLGLLSSGSLWGLSQANNYAALSRLNTGAQVAAQNQIDLLVATGPFNPQKGQLGAKRIFPDVRPPIWTLGQSAPDDVLVYSEGEDAFGVPIRPVHGSRVTVVKDMGSLNLYSATVEVTYIFRGKSYSVRLNAIRTADAAGA